MKGSAGSSKIRRWPFPASAHWFFAKMFGHESLVGLTAVLTRGAPALRYHSVSFPKSVRVMATLDAGQRIIELAGGLLAQAEALNLSVAGGIARIYTLVEDGDLDAACEVLDAIDEAINAAREVGGNP